MSAKINAGAVVSLIHGRNSCDSPELGAHLHAGCHVLIQSAGVASTQVAEEAHSITEIK